MASWCTVTVTWAGNGYSKNFKRDIGVHSHTMSAQFVVDAKNAALGHINPFRPPGAHIGANALGTSNLRVYMQNDPGAAYSQI
jgi:hypothetical protein